MTARAWIMGLGLLLVLAAGAYAEAVVEFSMAFTDRVNAVAVDQDGLIWMGTPGGVLRWDAPDSYVHWTAADGLPDNWVSDIVVAPDGAIWVSMATWLGGVSTLVDGRWTTFDERNGLVSDFVRDLAVDESGSIWAATADGLCALTPVRDPETGGVTATITTLAWDGDPAVARPEGVAVDVSGRVWVWRKWGNLVVLDANRTPHDPSDDVWTLHTADRLAVEQPIERVLPDPLGSIWITHRSRGATVFDDGQTADPADDRIVSYVSGEGFPSDSSSFLAFDDENRLWVPTTRGDLYVLAGAETPFDLSDDSWRETPLPEELPPWGPRGLVAEDGGNLWLIAGNREGVIHLDHGGTPTNGTDDRWDEFLVESQLASHDVRAFAFTGGHVWVASDGGVVVRTDDGWQEALSASVYGIAGQGPVVWAGTWGGLFALELVDGEIVSTRYETEQGLADNYVNAVAVDPLGRVWCGLPRVGVSVLDPADTPHDSSDDQWVLLTHDAFLEGQGVGAIGFEGSSRVWFGLGEAGAIALDFGSTLGDPSDDLWVRYDRAGGMPSGGVYSVLIEDGPAIWLGGCSNVVVLDPGADLVDTDDDLLTAIHQSNCTAGLTKDSEGVLWFADGWNGIRRYDLAGTPHILEDDSWHLIRTSDGLLDNRTTTLAIGPDGRIWIGTDAGLTVLRWE